MLQPQGLHLEKPSSEEDTHDRAAPEAGAGYSQRGDKAGRGTKSAMCNSTADIVTWRENGTEDDDPWNPTRNPSRRDTCGSDAGRDHRHTFSAAMARIPGTKTPEKINHWRGLHEGPRGMRSWNDLEARMGFAPQSLLGRLAEEGVGARYVYNEAEARAAWGTRPWPPPRHEVRM